MLTRDMQNILSEKNRNPPIGPQVPEGNNITKCPGDNWYFSHISVEILSPSRDVKIFNFGCTTIS